MKEKESRFKTGEKMNLRREKQLVSRKSSFRWVPLGRHLI